MGSGPTNAANKVKISWYSASKISDVNITDNSYVSISGGKVIFPQLLANITAPPIVEVQLVQTGQNFTLSQFDEVGPNQTNRGTLYFVPTANSSTARKGNNGDNYIGIWNGSMNVVSSGDVVKTNNHSIMNKVFSTYCNKVPSTEFYCNVEIELPGVIGGGARSNNTFMISVALPYQRPNTDFSIELCDAGGCNSPVPLNDLQNTTTNDSGVKKISNVQIAIDSTGRANDLYRRVEARVETADTTFGTGYPYYALEILGDDGINKTIKSNYEYPFYF